MRLILNPGREGEQELLLPEGTTTIGRTDEASVCVLHKSLSRRHARLERQGSRVVLVDQGSKNGTFLGEVRVERHILQEGDAFRCGEVWFQLLAGDPAPEEELSPLHTRTLDTRFTLSPLETLLDADAPRLRVRPEPAGDLTRERLQVLLAVAQLLSSPGALDTLLERILQLVFRILGVDRAALLLVDEATGELRPRVTRAANGETPPERFYSQRIVDFVREHGLASLFANAQGDLRLDSSASIRAQAILSAMCVPLRPRDTWLGVLYVDNRSQGGLFTEEDLEFLTAFANQAAVAIDNARLSRRLEEEAVLRNTYLRFFPPAVVRRLNASPGAMLEVVETEVTVLFADISDFTPLSESLRPREVVDMLNEYFPVMADAVFRHEGTLEKYIGDALMAVWGAPFSREDDADRALRAAVDMQRALVALNARFRAKGHPELRIHVGLNSGPAAAGNIGSERYLQYATLGDVTNVASRVCGVARAGEVVLSDATRTRLRDSTWRLTTLPPTRVKGKQDALTLHQVAWDG
ncbi:MULTISPECIES: adenylate/guanylate cyclase domain-containing protein [Myxococcus]|uniref:adenylate/guanylate cyclase domain-containing protein n=1 Tax=Myxococcus TaxID=32 RepID=UPI0013D841A5|nr:MULTISPECIES: adenylate/guanylate cyclase domain-containing protein [Myxococcus]NVJ27465.1 GAF domain-containing protein [Myxococcus sp. AM011]